jgi:hypothetical protein
MSHNIHTHGVAVQIDGLVHLSDGSLSLRLVVDRADLPAYIGGCDEVILYELGAAELERMIFALRRIADAQRDREARRLLTVKEVQHAQ